MKNILLLLALFSLIGRSSAQSESQNMPAIQDSMMQQYQLGNYKEGKDLAIQILTIDTSNEVAIDVLAKIYDSEQNTARAIKFYTLKFQKDTLDGNVARKLAQLYAEAEIFTEAIDFYKKALSLNDRDIVSIRGFSEVYFAVDALDYADSLCKKGLEIDSNNVGLLLIDARVSYKQRDMNRVISDLEKAGNLTNLSNYYLRMLGYAYLQVDLLDEAIHSLMFALETDRNPEFTYYYLGLAHERKGNFEIAVNYFNRAIDAGISKEIGNYYFRIGQLKVKQNLYKEAIPELEKALIYEKSNMTYYLLAISYDKYYKDKRKALIYYGKVSNYNGQFDDQMKEFAKSRMLQIKELLHQKN